MRKKHLLAAIAVAVGTATALAAPASADDQLDQAFLKGLQQKGITVKSDQYALDLAHSTCDLLNGGGSVNDALNMIVKKTKWSTQKSADFGGIAVYAYCKDKIPAGTGG
ncbi:hypothetical protein GGC64_004042 [Mycobacterium sp. OAS707]|uniref:DUF732 domain-containing protein n=1 Tax=unclassified Mycobacterium TaxID=2642494 RepID=UPI0017891084|nr:DUF732 domain-containing protein [Mycobacterium sp. OAS707]MBE1550002.1 hypothetical protein [Mycobacterium sp. OAS707]